MALDRETEAVDTTMETGLKLLGQALEAIPSLVGIIERGLAGSTPGDPLADRVRRMLPVEGASARALRDLEQDRQG